MNSNMSNCLCDKDVDLFSHNIFGKITVEMFYELEYNSY